MLRTLTKRTYIGEGYVHRFVHNTTNEIVYVPCTEQEYVRLGLPGGAQFNPVMADHTWECSFGGTLKVDTPNTLLGADEYCIKEGKAHVFLPDTIEGQYIFNLTDIVDEKIDEDKIIRVKTR